MNRPVQRAVFIGIGHVLQLLDGLTCRYLFHDIEFEQNFQLFSEASTIIPVNFLVFILGRSAHDAVKTMQDYIRKGYLSRI